MLAITMLEVTMDDPDKYIFLTKKANFLTKKGLEHRHLGVQIH